MSKNAKLNIMQLQAAVFALKLQFSHHGSNTSLDLKIVVKMLKNAKLNILQLKAPFSQHGSYTSLDL